jgi:hypothetical protein
MTINPWNIPPFPARGDDSEDSIYASIGQALSRWEYLEVGLMELFAALANNKHDSSAISRAYGAVVTSRGRLDMLEAAASAYFIYFPNNKLQSALENQLTKVRQYGTRRNEIAHGIVQPYSIFKPFKGDDSGGYCLFPSFYNTNKMLLETRVKLTPKYIYSSKEIKKFAACFMDMVPPIGTITLKILARQTTRGV